MSRFESSNIPQSDHLSFFDIKYIVRRRTDYPLNSAFPKPLHANTRLYTRFEPRVHEGYYKRTESNILFF